MRFTPKLVPSVRSNHMGVITLNNPTALHALTLDMIDAMNDTFSEWLSPSSSSGRVIRSILIKPSNDETKRPAFCAGGDVKTLCEMSASASTSTTTTPATTTSVEKDFFYQEYKTNYTIATCPIPIISLWDGVVFGGGVGISIHGKYRVATEHTLFAMPETAIGLYPDVGGMWFLPRIMTTTLATTRSKTVKSPNPIANYLALTGQRLGPADLLYSGLATHYVPSDRLRELEEAIADATAAAVSTSPTTKGSSSSTTSSESTDDVDTAIAHVLMSFHENIPTQDCHLVTNKKRIEKFFREDTVEDIFSNLTAAAKESNGSHEESDVQFATSTLKTLQKMSPTSLKLTLEGLRRGASCQSIGEDLKMEYRMSTACLRPNSDFFEGVRAMLVDKDRSPKWNPPTAEEVTTEMVEEFFAPIRGGGYEWEAPSGLSTTTSPSKL